MATGIYSIVCWAAAVSHAQPSSTFITYILSPLPTLQLTAESRPTAEEALWRVRAALLGPHISDMSPGAIGRAGAEPSTSTPRQPIPRSHPELLRDEEQQPARQAAQRQHQLQQRQPQDGLHGATVSNEASAGQRAASSSGQQQRPQTAPAPATPAPSRRAPLPETASISSSGSATTSQQAAIRTRTATTATRTATPSPTTVRTPPRHAARYPASRPKEVNANSQGFCSTAASRMIPRSQL